jgi:hypothetical protein
LIQQRYTNGLDKINKNFSPGKQPSHTNHYDESYGKPSMGGDLFKKKSSKREREASKRSQHNPLDVTQKELPRDNSDPSIRIDSSKLHLLNT